MAEILQQIAKKKEKPAEVIWAGNEESAFGGVPTLQKIFLEKAIQICKSLFETKVEKN